MVKAPSKPTARSCTTQGVTPPNVTTADVGAAAPAPDRLTVTDWDTATLNAVGANVDTEGVDAEDDVNVRPVAAPLYCTGYVPSATAVVVHTRAVGLESARDTVHGAPPIVMEAEVDNPVPDRVTCVP